MPDAYRIVILPSAKRELKDIHQPLLGRIVDAISSMADNPRLRGSKKLAGSDSDYRVRVGDYRILYEVNDADQTVSIYRIRHRRNAYQ